MARYCVPSCVGCVEQRWRGVPARAAWRPRSVAAEVEDANRGGPPGRRARARARARGASSPRRATRAPSRNAQSTN